MSNYFICYGGHNFIYNEIKKVKQWKKITFMYLVRWRTERRSGQEEYCSRSVNDGCCRIRLQTTGIINPLTRNAAPLKRTVLGCGRGLLGQSVHCALPPYGRVTGVCWAKWMCRRKIFKIKQKVISWDPPARFLPYLITCFIQKMRSHQIDISWFQSVCD